MSKHYSNSFKQEALKLSDEIGVKKAASQLGLPYYTLADWRNRNRDRIEGNEQPDRPEQPVHKYTAAELRIRELERENAELKSANEILKDALCFFAKDRKK